MCCALCSCLCGLRVATWGLLRCRRPAARPAAGPAARPPLACPLACPPPPPQGDLRALSYEDSKYLGGDVAHTHLVKGLDFALLQKARGRRGTRAGGGWLVWPPARSARSLKLLPFSAAAWPHPGAAAPPPPRPQVRAEQAAGGGKGGDESDEEGPVLAKPVALPGDRGPAPTFKSPLGHAVHAFFFDPAARGPGVPVSELFLPRCAAAALARGRCGGLGAAVGWPARRCLHRLTAALGLCAASRSPHHPPASPRPRLAQPHRVCV